MLKLTQPQQASQLDLTFTSVTEQRDLEIEAPSRSLKNSCQVSSFLGPVILPSRFVNPGARLASIEGWRVNVEWRVINKA